MAWDVAGCERMRPAALAHQQGPGDRLSAQLQHRCTRPPTRASSRPASSATCTCRASPGIATATGAARATPPVARLQPVQVGLSRLRAPAELAPLQALLARAARGARQPPAEHRQLVLRRRARRRCIGTGGVYRFKDGREVGDHVYATFEYPGGRTAVFSSVESNAFDHYYEAFFGTNGTLILQGEAEAYLFDEGTGQPAVTGIEVTPREGAARARGIREPRRRCRRHVRDGRRGGVQPRSAGRLSQRDLGILRRRPDRHGRWPAARIARSGRRAPASPPSRPSPADACRSAAARSHGPDAARP